MIHSWFLERGLEAIGIDASLNMVKMAMYLHDTESILAKAESLPFPNEFFRTVVITTGVLDIENNDLRYEVLNEALRVICNSGTILIGVFAPSPETRATGQEIGYMEGWCLNQRRLFEIWDASQNSSRWAALVSEWKDITLEQATYRVKKYIKNFVSIYQNLELLARAGHMWQIEPRLYLKQSLNFKLFGRSEKEHEDIITKCGTRIDLNMVRASVVNHPSEWPFSGYNEIQKPRQRYALIDYKKLRHLLGIKSYAQLKESHRRWVEASLASRTNGRERKWTESIAVGSRHFVEDTKAKLGVKASGRALRETNGVYELRELHSFYSTDFGPKNDKLSSENTYFWSVYS